MGKAYLRTLSAGVGFLTDEAFLDAWQVHHLNGPHSESLPASGSRHLIPVLHQLGFVSLPMLQNSPSSFPLLPFIFLILSFFFLSQPLYNILLTQPLQLRPTCLVPSESALDQNSRFDTL